MPGADGMHVPEPSARPDDGEVDQGVVVDHEIVDARAGGAVGEPQRELDEAGWLGGVGAGAATLVERRAAVAAMPPPRGNDRAG